MRSLPAVGVALALWICTGPIANAQSPITNLIRSLESDKKPVRLQAAVALGNCGKGASAAAPALKALVERELEPQIYLQGMKALTQIGAHAELLALLQHSGPHVRPQAIWGLGVIGPDAKAAVPELTRVLRDHNAALRSLAAQALGEIGPAAQSAVPDLIKMLGDAQPAARQQALQALTNIGPAVVAPLLDVVRIDKLSEPERQRRAPSGPSLALRLGSVEFDRVEYREPAWVRMTALQVLASHGRDAKQATPVLVTLLKDPDARVRTQAAQTLTAIGPDAKEALPGLLEALLDKSVEVQSAAFAASLTVGQGDIPAAMKGLREINAKGSWATPYVLSQYGEKTTDATPHLIKGLRDNNPGVRLGAAIALGQIGPQARADAAPALTETLKDQNAQVRFAAYQALMLMDEQKREGYQKLVKLQAEQAKRFTEKYMEVVGKQQELIKSWNDPMQQAYIRQIVHMQIAYSQPFRNNESMVSWAQERISEFGPEAIPALVQGINLVADYKIGFV